ncbi:PITH domain-containing protein 1-like isoform X1 [Salvelinus fontinalis]|uniref:PITH domain-containing protein 1-like isoform X1 n=1 Tax=Salvelinus fontinalis TaxID=8038 RepID=UPI0024853D52|nr:PITH domain-containing protein 1-like isoform X1 [Salvelinus fontinalis]
MSGHGGHSHGCCEDEHEPAERGLEYALYQRIDVEKLQCLNEAREGDGKLVFKPWDQRTDREKFVESDADEELLFNIPFTGSVKLKGIIIAGEDDESHPAEMRLNTRTYPTCPLMTHAENLSMSSVSIEIHWLSWNTQLGLPVFPTLITCQFTYHGTLGQSPHGSTTLG